MSASPLDSNSRFPVDIATAGIFQAFRFERVLDTCSGVHTYCLIYISVFISHFKSRISNAWNRFFIYRFKEKHHRSYSVNPIQVFHNLDENSEAHLTHYPSSLKKKRCTVLWTIILLDLKQRKIPNNYFLPICVAWVECFESIKNQRLLRKYEIYILVCNLQNNIQQWKNSIKIFNDLRFLKNISLATLKWTKGLGHKTHCQVVQVWIKN